MNKRILPSPLERGDCIQVIAPAGQLASIESFRQGLGILEQMGFSVQFPENLWPGQGFLADTDTHRAEEFNQAFLDDKIKAVFALRGGYGCLRMLEKIDLDLVRQRPKLLVGFSDITLLQNHLLATTGLLSLHGPVLSTLATSTPTSLARLHQCLTGSWRMESRFPNIEILRGGAAVQGILAGGNLSSLVSALSTPFDFSWKDRVVFLEDTNEPPYRLDRMLTQLALAGKFKDVAGILLGDFWSAGSENELEKLRRKEWLWERVLDLSASSHTPVWAGLPVGHCPENLTLPIGSLVTVKSDRVSLSFS
jgi:muramoyltetrapeptide carboxypeptidase